MRKLKALRKEISGCQIQYIIIDKEISIKTDPFSSIVYELLRHWPKSLLQLINPENYYIYIQREAIYLGPNIFQLTDFIFKGNDDEILQLFNHYSSQFNKDIVRVFLINAELEEADHIKACNLLKNLDVAYFCIIGKEGDKISCLYNIENKIYSISDLVAYLKRDWNKINDLLFAYRGDRLPEKFIYSDSVQNAPYNVTVCQTNYYTLNQIIGNIWSENKKVVQVDSPPNDRVKHLISQITTIDSCFQTFRVIGYPTPDEPKFQPLILIAPYHSPNTKRAVKANNPTKTEKNIFQVYSSEQEQDYQFRIPDQQIAATGNEFATTVLRLLGSKLIMLDCFGYLHASFTYSPTLRLPVIGDSINAELSHLLGSFSNRKSVIKIINKIGKSIKDKILHPEIEELIKKRDGQIVAITDLPIEWTILKNNYPLSLTHDVCRIPEFNYNSLVNNYIQHNRNSFRIDDSILSQTLVIQCASKSDTAIHICFDALIPLQQKLKFNIVKCNTIEDIKRAIDKFEPNLLIFDCHGDFEKESGETFLVIDSDNGLRLTGQDIIENEIVAPLVFISACSTHPSYGFAKYLTDAFCEAGALSVTATYLPILMDEATILISRLLNTLSFQSQKSFHHNWLGFISHIFRSASIYEMINKIAKSGKIVNYDSKELSKIMSGLFTFDRRHLVIDEVIKYLKKLNPSLSIDFSNFDNEWLSYTTVGRPDLILFKKWEEQNRELFLKASNNVNS